jgi:hypothetical protein
MFNQPIDPSSIWKSTEGLPEEQRKYAFEKLLTPDRSSSDINSLMGIIDKINDPERRKETLDQQLAYDKARMKEAFPYLMAREIPRQISEGFGSQAALNVLGARNAVEAMNQTLTAYPKLNFPMTPFRAEKYLS